jgi:hypothetical protein
MTGVKCRPIATLVPLKERERQPDRFVGLLECVADLLVETARRKDAIERVTDGGDQRVQEARFGAGDVERQPRSGDRPPAASSVCAWSDQLFDSGQLAGARGRRGLSTARAVTNTRCARFRTARLPGVLNERGNDCPFHPTGPRPWVGGLGRDADINARQRAGHPSGLRDTLQDPKVRTSQGAHMRPWPARRAPPPFGRARPRSRRASTPARRRAPRSAAHRPELAPSRPISAAL